MYCFFCGKHLELAKLITAKDRINKKKQIQLGCINCEMHVNKIVEQNYSDKKATKELKKDFVEFTAHLIDLRIKRG